jgi:uncharacterized protein (DUF697 family)
LLAASSDGRELDAGTVAASRQRSMRLKIETNAAHQHFNVELAWCACYCLLGAFDPCRHSTRSRLKGEFQMANEVAEAESTQLSDDDRFQQATKIVDRFSLWSGAAGLLPIPLLDVTVVAGVQIQMLRRLAELYDVKFSENLGKSGLASLMGSLIPVTSGMGFASALKGVPLFGTVASLASMPVLSAGATYLIGRVFVQHFASGGTLFDFKPPDYKEFINEQADKLKAKLDAPSGSKIAPDRAARAKGTTSPNT